MPKRCGWVKMTNPLYVAYHDEEWGRPLHDDQALFELLCMETYQAGLSWETVLNKRQAFREAFHSYHQPLFEIERRSLRHGPTPRPFYKSRRNSALLMPISGLLLRGKPSTMMSRITVKHQRRQLFLRS